MTMKPHLACDIDRTKVQFPCAGLPKIDGVRGMNLFGNMTGRSMKPHKNKYTTAMFSKPEFIGFDGELAEGCWTSPSLCRDTSSSVGRIAGEPDIKWWVFDCLDEFTSSLCYMERYRELERRVNLLNLPHVRLVPLTILNNMEELDAYHNANLDAGFEGTIIRALEGMHKSGRATTRHGAYLRIKDFVEEEAVILSIEEAMENQNEAKTNELGRSERSSHAANMVPKGMVGNLIGRMLKDVYDGDRLLLKKDQQVTIGPGEMDHKDRTMYFENQHLIVGKVVKFKFFPKGVKDKPRFPTFVTIREESDIS
jgi:DNA ligase-1